MKTRVIQINGKFYPQRYGNFGWKNFKNKSDYEVISFSVKEVAIKFCEIEMFNAKEKSRVVWSSDEN